MANNLTDAAELLALDWINVVGTPTRPTSPLKVALFTTMPNQETGAGGVEVSSSGTAYARQTVVFTAAAAGAASNNADINFPVATAAWGTVLGGGVYDSAGTPVLIWSGTLGASKDIQTGDSFKIPSGSLTVTLN